MKKQVMMLCTAIILFSAFSKATAQSEVKGNPVIIGYLKVAQYDFTEKMTWKHAKKSCASLGKGWRLPTKEELNTLFINKDNIGGFADDFYWSATVGYSIDNNKDMDWVQLFFGGRQDYMAKTNEFKVRAVRDR